MKPSSLIKKYLKSGLAIHVSLEINHDQAKILQKYPNIVNRASVCHWDSMPEGHYFFSDLLTGKNRVNYVLENYYNSEPVKPIEWV